jgi:hypothetical protein
MKNLGYDKPLYILPFDWGSFTGCLDLGHGEGALSVLGYELDLVAFLARC